MFQVIDEKKKQLNAKCPLPAYTLRSLKEKLLLEWTYHSNAIEQKISAAFPFKISDLVGVRR
ncbi:hypothetical protein M3221_23415 [Domibacillus indicus]|uniref:hypothetical protein n=1 Tax=Domibacillus indicus TaxID=1437523 RepID=UPI00203AE0AC|nr:hypothetical protein [Domibacillus indicus]MCM3791287.1 hypothetical protein [Domibacillus indicus]